MKFMTIKNDFIFEIGYFRMDFENENKEFHFISKMKLFGIYVFQFRNWLEIIFLTNSKFIRNSSKFKWNSDEMDSKLVEN